MKPISEMNLAECLEEVEMLYSSQSYGDPERLANRIHDLTAEWERRWNNLSVAQKIDAIAHPPEPYSLDLIIKSQSKVIANLGKELSDLKESTRWIPVSDKEIEQVADDEKQQDWDRLEYQDVYRDGFIEGANWMQSRIHRITPPETP